LVAHQRHKAMDSKNRWILGVTVSLLIVALASPTWTQGESTAFDVNSLKRIVVAAQTGGNGTQSGIIVSPEGHVLIFNSEGVEVGDGVTLIYPTLDQPIEGIVSHTTIENEPSLYPFALVEITPSDVEMVRNRLINGDFGYYSPLIAYETADLNEVVYSVTHAVTASDTVVPLLTTGTIYAVIDRQGLPIAYSAKVTTQGQEALGGILVNGAGRLIGIIVNYDTTTRVALSFSINQLCVGDSEFCQVLMELYRDSPSDRRSRPPSSLSQLTDGRGISNGARVSNGEAQLEYFCRALGLELRPNMDNEIWECFNPAIPDQSFPLLPQHHDLICQQTYRNPKSIAFQIDIEGVERIYSWRCYE